MTDGMLSLSWKNHSTTFCHTLAALRSKERYTDATVACNGKFYSVHKLVLSSCSEYFEEIFDHTPCKHPVIVLKDVQVDELEAILNYMYAGEVSVAQTDLTRLIKVAELLKIKGLAVSDEPMHPRTIDSRSSSSEAPDHSSLSSPKRQKTLELTSESPAFGYRDEEQHQNATRRYLPDLHQTDLNQEISSVHIQGQKQDIKVKEEIVEITTAASENDMGLNFGILQEDGQLKGTLRGSQSDPNLMIKCQNLEPLGNQVAYSNGLTNVMSGPSEMQDWFPELDTATTLAEGENANRGNSCLQVRMEANDNMLPGRTVSPNVAFLHSLGGSHHSEGQSSYTPLQSPIQKNTKMYRSNVEKPYACPYCNFRSALKCNLKIHIRTHTGEKPFSCHLCPQRFSVRCNLKTHLRTHTGEKPFCCPHCSYRCAHKSDMNKHVMTHTL